VLGQALPSGVRFTVLADRPFGDQALYLHLVFIGWDYVIRLRLGQPKLPRRRAATIPGRHKSGLCDPTPRAGPLR
jgi:hypothetical protein